MAEDREGPHTVYDIRYHLVWMTKRRDEVLRGPVAERTRELVRQGCESLEIGVLKGHVGRDHLHVLVASPPTLAPGQIVRYLKDGSSRLLQQEFSHLKERYCGRRLWARGYLCGTVGEVTGEQIARYVGGHRVAEPGAFTIADD